VYASIPRRSGRRPRTALDRIAFSSAHGRSLGPEDKCRGITSALSEAALARQRPECLYRGCWERESPLPGALHAGHPELAAGELVSDPGGRQVLEQHDKERALELSSVAMVLADLTPASLRSRGRIELQTR